MNSATSPAGPDQPFRRDRGAAKIDIKVIKIFIEAGQRIVHDLPDLSQRMPSGDALFKIDIAEQRPVLLVRSPHNSPPTLSCRR
ncbi:hypothetical protein CN97_08020 [Haematobacter massiliensis]|uniref:Uncharacterized protein n=1 Tax=Haematobacter massiliensis TaxID=195105 RepID=A0A086XUD6_9RHOB|nr:hypothetical protein CN97_08020 [Haematobacter massiliensis]